jgi:hypothetical protein
MFALKRCISDQKCFNNETKRAWKNATQIMSHHFINGLNSEEKEMKNQERLNRNSNLY